MRTCYLTHIIDDNNPRGWSIRYVRRYPYICKHCLSPFKNHKDLQFNCTRNLSFSDLRRSYRLRSNYFFCIHYRLIKRRYNKSVQLNLF